MNISGIFKGNYLEVRQAATGRHHAGIVSIREGWQEVRRGFRQRRSNFTQPLGRRKGFINIYGGEMRGSAVCWGGKNTWYSELFNKINVGDVRGLYHTY